MRDPEGDDPQVRDAEDLGEAVVHLPGDPLPFGDDRALALALARPRARDRDRGEV